MLKKTVKVDNRLRYRIELDHDLCQGHSVCIAEAPALFSLNESSASYDQIQLITSEIGEEQSEAAFRAQKYCPNGVIRVLPIEDS